MESPGRKLRDMIAAPAILVLPGVYDGPSTRLVKHFGFPAAFISGGSVSESRVGTPDFGLIGYEGAVDAVRAIAAATDMVLLADADTGYGNAVNVYHVVRGFEQTGIGGMMIEDQVWPKRCGHLAGKQVIPAEEMVQKIHAATAARIDPDFVIKSRTDSFATDGLKEVIRRLNLYAEAGADLLFADALMSEADIATVAKEVSKPLCVNMGFGLWQRPTTPLIPVPRLQEMGVAVVIYPRLLPACAMMGMKHGLTALQQSLGETRVVERPDLVMAQDELLSILGIAEIKALEQKFLTGNQLHAMYGG